MENEKLDTATAEIQAVLQKHEIAGLFILHIPGATKYSAHLSPPWSCCKIEGDNMKINTSIMEFPDKETQKKVVLDTVNMLAAFRQAASDIFDGMSGMLRRLRRDHNVDDILGLEKINGKPPQRIILPPGHGG